MIIYIILKLLTSYYLIFKKRLIKDPQRLSLIMDFMVIIVFLLLLYKNSNLILLSITILKFSIIIIMLFIIYRFINYLLWIDLPIVTNEKIRKFFLKPIVCDIIYYTIWLLPWNVGYWVYFYIMEHGWYWRVWISSTRDIVFWKLFKWDSRDFFYKLNERIRIKNLILIKDTIIKMMWRVQYLIYILRGSIQSVKISKYIYMRIVVYMYLSIFYVYGLAQIIILNKILFIMLIIIELIVLYKLKEIIEYFDPIIEGVIWNKLIFEMGQAIEIQRIKEGLKNPFLTSTRYKYFTNKFHWDRILSNSLSLRILHKYIYYVDKNTKGYFNKKMNLHTTINEFKDYDGESGLIWSVLPRTRYVVMSLKNWAYDEKKKLFTNTGDNNDPHIVARDKVNLTRNRNFYLSYYEKTYSESSLLMLIWFLRNNFGYWFSYYIQYHITNMDFFNSEDFSDFFDINQPIELMLSFFIYIYVKDKRLISDVNMILEFFLDRKRKYYLEELYFINYEERLKEKRKELMIPDKICSLKNYKKMFKIMSKVMLFKEWGIIWNEELQKKLEKFERLRLIDGDLKLRDIDMYLLFSRGYDSTFGINDGWMDLTMGQALFNYEKIFINERDLIHCNGEYFKILEEIESYEELKKFKLELSSKASDVDLELIIIILMLIQIELSYCFTRSIEEIRLDGNLLIRFEKYKKELEEYRKYFGD